MEFLRYLQQNEDIGNLQLYRHAIQRAMRKGKIDTLLAYLKDPCCTMSTSDIFRQAGLTGCTELLKNMIYLEPSEFNNGVRAALIPAIERGNIQLAKLLWDQLNYRARKDYCDRGFKYGKRRLEAVRELNMACPMGYAIMNNDIEMAREALNKARREGTNLNGSIHHAAQLGRIEIVEAMVEHGASINETIDGQTPLMSMCSSSTVTESKIRVCTPN